MMHSTRLSTPRVTVIVPTYNRADMLPACLQSVFAQTYPNIELIVVDDGSTDDTQEILRPHAAKIRILRQENAGPYVAMNHALKHAQGEFVTFLGSDDAFRQDKVGLQVDRFLRDEGLALVYTHHAFRVPSGDILAPPAHRQVSVTGDVSVEVVRRFGLGITWASAMIPLEIISAVGTFDTTHRVAMDLELMTRVLRRGRIDVIQQPLYEITLHTSHISQNVTAKEKAYGYILRKVFGHEPFRSDRRLQRESEAGMFLSLSRLAYVHHLNKQSRGYLIKALRAAPRALARPASISFTLKVALGRRKVNALARFLGLSSESGWLAQDQSEEKVEDRGQSNL
ncbi:MAG: glycosyltransferase [Candidatus Eisenbacteria bacterium]|nr:glycosyltransferase [Candidatus Eisenbacteria bacterium]